MILLTGGAGFIGSCALKKLNDENVSDVLVVDRLGKNEKWKNLAGKRLLEFVHKDELFDRLAAEEWENEIDAIIHLGACSDTTEKDADYIFRYNFSYSVALAEYAAENDIRFIYASSAATYGDGSNGYSDDEFDSLLPLNPYGLSKHLFDQWVIQQGLDSSFVGLKFFNVYGPNEYHKGEMASMVYKSFLQIRDSGKVRLFKSNSSEYKDGEQKRDFVYVKDVIEIIWKILNDDKISGIYNVGTGEARSWNDLVGAVFEALGKEPSVEYVDMPDELNEQYQNFTQAEVSKLKNVLPGLEFTKLEDGVKDYAQNYLTKKWRYF